MHGWPLCAVCAVCHDTLATASSGVQQKHVVFHPVRLPFQSDWNGRFLLDSDENKVSCS